MKRPLIIMAVAVMVSAILAPALRSQEKIPRMEYGKIAAINKEAKTLTWELVSIFGDSTGKKINFTADDSTEVVINGQKSSFGSLATGMSGYVSFHPAGGEVERLVKIDIK